MLGSGTGNFCLAIQIEIMVGNENVLAFILLWSRDYSVFVETFTPRFSQKKTFLFKAMFVLSIKFVCQPSFLGNDCISFYGNHVTIVFKETILSFQIHFVQQKHNVQMAAVMMQVVPCFYSVYATKSVHICANTYEMYLVSKDYCVAQHENSMCTVPNCK